MILILAFLPLSNSNPMPIVYVAEPEPRRGRPRKLLQMIVPRLKDPDALDYERWEWDELRVDASAIPGCGPMFGLYPRNTEAFSWASLDRTTIVPYLGKETEVESSQLARLLRSSTVGVQSGAVPQPHPLRLRSTRLAALGSSVLPGRGRPSGRAAAASGARTGRFRSRPFSARLAVQALRAVWQLRPRTAQRDAHARGEM